jgi:hypothetical protein
MEIVTQVWQWIIESGESVLAKVAAAYYWLLASYPHLALLGTVLTIIGGFYTLYRIRLGWDGTRRKLFLKYLRAEETKIDGRKGPVSRRLQDAKRISIVPEDLDVHAIIDKAIAKFDKGALEEAEIVLRELNGRLSHRISFAEKPCWPPRDVELRALDALVGGLGQLLPDQQAPVFTAIFRMSALCAPSLLLVQIKNQINPTTVCRIVAGRRAVEKQSKEIQAHSQPAII